MPPRKKASTPAGDTDDDFRAPKTPGVMPGVTQVITNLNKLRATRTNIHKDVDSDHAKAVAALKARITKHYQYEAQKRSKLMSKQLERLEKAIEKKNACEDAILELMNSLAKDGAHIAALMTAVHTGRKNAVQAAISSNLQDEQN